jgi:hypothetical protein
MRSVWQRYDALATDGDTSSASSARVFTLLISALKRLVTSRPILLGVSAQMHGVGVPAGDSQSHLHSHHSLDSVAEMVATAASATMSNVVGMIGTEAGLSVQTATMKVQWYVSPIDVLPISCQPFLVTVFFLLASISSTKQMHHSSRRRTYISLACNASSHSPTALRGILSLSTTPSRSKSHPQVQPSPCVHRAHSTLLCYLKLSQPGLGYGLCARC